MHRQTASVVSEALFYIEENLDSRLNLQTVASALHCSKYHLHRSFSKAAGLTIHDYVRRRQLQGFWHFPKNRGLKSPL